MRGVLWSTLIATALAAARPCGAALIDDGISLLKMPISAEASSLGGVFPLQEGVDAVFTNPAGLDHINKNAVSLTHAALVGDTSIDALAAGARLGERGGVLGLSVVTLTQKAITARDESGAAAGSLSAYDAFVGLFWAISLRRHRVGLGYKHVRQSLAGVVASGHAADLGYQYRLAKLTGGISIQNLGTQMRFLDEAAPLPLAISAGAKYAVLNAFLLNVAASHRPYARRTTTGFGAELMLGQAISLRAGYLAPLTAAAAGSMTSLHSNLGFGAGWKFFARRLKVDYSMVPGSAQVGMTHRFTMQLGWGGKAGFGQRDEGLDEPDYYTPYFQAL